MHTSLCDEEHVPVVNVRMSLSSNSQCTDNRSEVVVAKYDASMTKGKLKSARSVHFMNDNVSNKGSLEVAAMQIQASQAT